MLSIITIFAKFAKKMFRTTKCKLLSIVSMCKNVVPNNNFQTVDLETIFKTTEKYQEHYIAKKNVVRTIICQRTIDTFTKRIVNKTNAEFALRLIDFQKKR